MNYILCSSRYGILFHGVILSFLEEWTGSETYGKMTYGWFYQEKKGQKHISFQMLLSTLLMYNMSVTLQPNAFSYMLLSYYT